MDGVDFFMSFLHTLSIEDLGILRRVVRNVHFQYYPDDLKYSDREADKLIDSFGQETIEKLIKQAVDTGVMDL